MMSHHLASRTRTLFAAIAVAVGATAGAGACASPTTPTAIRVRLAAAVFTRADGGVAAVEFTVTNAAADAVLLTSICGARLVPAVERREGGRWAQFSGGFCQTDQDMSPKPLAAGASRREVVGLREAGDYRLVLGAERGPVASDAFAVR